MPLPHQVVPSKVDHIPNEQKSIDQIISEFEVNNKSNQQMPEKNLSS
jgi:hypothetical protein